jgi:hypothetical protein
MMIIAESGHRCHGSPAEPGGSRPTGRPGRRPGAGSQSTPAPAHCTGPPGCHRSTAAVSWPDLRCLPSVPMLIRSRAQRPEGRIMLVTVTDTRPRTTIRCHCTG